MKVVGDETTNTATTDDGICRVCRPVTRRIWIIWHQSN